MTTKILGEQITSYTINTEQLSNTATAAFAKTLAPKILYANVASNNYTILDDTAVNVGGGYIVVTGAEFQSGATVLVDTTQASAVTYVNSTTLRAQVPAKSAASYNLYVVNPDGGTGLKVSGITYSGSPTWVTTSSLANVLSNVVFSNTFSATGATTYSNTTILPTGFTLLSNGYYYGNISVGIDTTYNFTIRATDAEAQDSDKDFSLTTLNALPSYTVDYLIVAGGGAGGSNFGGGGGAGGLLSGTTSVTPGTSYTITIGAGGSTGVSTGSNSSALNLVSFGGGKGGNGSQPGSSGGSGGGAGGNGQGPGLAIGSPGNGVQGTQGYPGGNSTSSPDGTAGGGGAGGAGENSIGYGEGRSGGGGYTWPITGSTYAGGGAGAGRGGYVSGYAGSGGGGNAGSWPGIPATPGTASTGGGGGGGYGFPTNGPGGSGGSGVVILAMPTPNYPGSAPGATVTTPPAAPGKTVLTYTSSGTFTA